MSPDFLLQLVRSPDFWLQLSLACFGLLALWMATGRNDSARQWAPVIGLCGQPFWIMFAVRSDAWGLLVISIAYTLVYLRALYLAWIYLAPPGR